VSQYTFPEPHSALAAGAVGFFEQESMGNAVSAKNSARRRSAVLYPSAVFLDIGGLPRRRVRDG
jgi:hypothetical protein